MMSRAFYSHEEARIAIARGTAVHVAAVIGHGTARLQIDSPATASVPGWRYRSHEWPHIAVPGQRELINRAAEELRQLGLASAHEVTVVDGDDFAPWDVFLCQPGAQTEPR